ncbi:MAG: alkaline phosphatase [Cyclobacteriaceae bacterium]|nr:alkaline phosphatase [Cyclobacteriaceae bacterium]
MKRRDFFRNGVLTSVGLGMTPAILGGCNAGDKVSSPKTAKNIIFLVSDGMSSGTLNMGDLLINRKLGRKSSWMGSYEENKMVRGLMDTASANALVTDSAAASSSWGGGKRVNNGALNVGPNGEQHKPILQKFKEAGKSVGCVTTVQIAHATPAGFCVNMASRGDMADIALEYLKLRFDVMMGGGEELFNPEKRSDNRNLFAEFTENGFSVAQDKASLDNLINDDKPLLGVFSEGGVPFTVDHINDNELLQKVPTLAEMTSAAIKKLSKNPKGFVMQVEGGKVDWAAHGNDAAALLYDQMAFDDAVGVALDFAESNGETLVIVTTDHGNANPGLFGAADQFDKLFNFRHSNEWIANGLQANATPAQLIERIEEASGGIVIDKNEAAVLLSAAARQYAPLNQRMKSLGAAMGQAMNNYIGIGWAGTGHSGDYVELGMYGPGSEKLPALIRNYELHNFMLDACAVQIS